LARVTRATKTDATTPENTVRKPMPEIITTTAINRPPTDVGTASPYPTVVAVCAAHQRARPTVGKALRSTAHMTTAETMITDIVTPAVSSPVRQIDGCELANRDATLLPVTKPSTR
jgi:hypothetical protein